VGHIPLPDIRLRKDEQKLQWMRHRMSDKLIQQNLKGIKKKQIYQAEVNLFISVDNILEGGIANLT